MVSHMQPRLTIFAALAIGLACFKVDGDEATNQPASKPLRYHASTGSKARLEGYSSAGMWQLETTLIAGFFEVDSSLPAQLGEAAWQGKIEGQADIFIPVRSLKSVEQRWAPYNDQINEVVYKKLRAQEAPRIRYRLTELFLRGTSATNDAPRAFDSKGQLVIAGVTNMMAMSGTMRLLPDKSLKITGKADILMSDFGLWPRLIICFGPDPDKVRLECEWVVTERNIP